MQEDQQARLEVSANDGLLNLNGVAQYLCCSRSYAARLMAEGIIPSFKVGSLRRVRKADLEAYVQSQLAAND